MPPARIFISHSSFDKPFAQKITDRLRNNKTTPWIDNENIISGDDILDSIGHGLHSIDFFIVLFSQTALQSNWVDLEIKHAFIQELNGKQALLMIFIIDDTRIEALPWFLQHRNIRKVSANDFGASAVVVDVVRAIERRLPEAKSDAKRSATAHDSIVEPLIRNIGPGDWDKAEAAALKVLEQTDRFGHNELFNLLLNYQDLEANDDLFLGAMQTAEVCVQLAPWLITHETLARLASQQEFSARAAAASICHDLVEIAPDRVPLDILMKLATPHEDWYVMAPATAALKTMAASQPPILGIFLERLRSEDPYLRVHAAEALADISKHDPQILSARRLRPALLHLQQIGDKEAITSIAAALSNAPEEATVSYRYGI
jgi:hypothetical protein